MADFRPFTTIYLIKDVDIDVSYNHQYYFESQSAQYNFFFNKRFETVAPATYQHKNSNTILVPFLADNLRDCKYMMWRNLEDEEGETSPVSQPHKGWYYAFVTGVDFIAPDTALIHYQLDVYQTYLFDVQWKQSFVEREHTQRFETRGSFVNMPVINTEDEGLEIGTEYKVTRVERINFTGDKGRIGWIVLAHTDIGLPFSTIGAKGVTTGLDYLVIPICPERQPWKYYIDDGNSRKEITDSINMLMKFASTTEMVNALVSAYYTPFIPLDYTVSITGTDVIIYTTQIATVTLYDTTFAIPRASDYEITEIGSNRSVYDYFPDYTESKMLMYPYSFIELTTLRGEAMPIKAEYLGTEGNALKIGVAGTMSTKNKLSYLIKNYVGQDGFVMETGLHDNSNMSVPFTTEYLATLLQSSSNALDVAQSNAKQYLYTAQDNASAVYGTSVANANRSFATSSLANVINATGNVVRDTTRGIGNAINNPLGVIGTTASTAGAITADVLGSVANEVNYWGSKENALDSANTSFANALRSANTTYQTTIASTLAKVNDARQIPPSAQSLGGDYLFNIAHNCDGIYAIYKTVTPEFANKLESYFKQYGYKVNRLEHPNFHTREHWNYIKMAEPNVYGNIPMDDLMAIRGIFMNGITLWHGDYIGDYNMSNNEI